MKLFISTLMSIIFLPFIITGILWYIAKDAFNIGGEIWESWVEKLMKLK